MACSHLLPRLSSHGLDVDSCIFQRSSDGTTACSHAQALSRVERLLLGPSGARRSCLVLGNAKADPNVLNHKGGGGLMV